MNATEQFIQALIDANPDVNWDNVDVDEIRQAIDEEQDLFLNDIPINNLPPEVGLLQNLSSIDIVQTNIINLPEELFDINEIDHLSIIGAPLLTISKKIGLLTNLKLLDLSDTDITALPQEIGQLERLQSLNVSSTQLEVLPAEIKRLRNLEYLNITKTPLSVLPSEIGQLKNLKYLLISDTMLTALPTEIGKLCKLEYLNASKTSLSILPNAIGYLEKLQTLELSETQLITLPCEIGLLQNLTSLYVGGENIFRFLLIKQPFEEEIQLDLKELDISEINIDQQDMHELKTGDLIISVNQNIYCLKNLPTEIGDLKQLEILDASYTQLSELPKEVLSLENLKWLFLTQTQLPIPPEILEYPHAPQYILDYYFQPSRELREAKVVLIGEGRVGKTSLVRSLFGEQHDPDETTTEGIVIRDWEFIHNENEYTAHLWDFGGQELMHATHQFFMTARTLYILVLNSRMSEEQNRLYYWLDLIQSLGGSSPVLIVRNHCDEGVLDLDRRSLVFKYPAIREIYLTSCTTKQGLAQLWAELPQHLLTLPHIHDQMPIPWYEVKERFQGLQRNYISYDEFLELCTQVGMEYEYEHERLISFLHDLGVLVFFDEWELRDKPVLNPSWIAEGVYAILHARQHVEHGLLNVSAIDQILDRARYPRHMHPFIVNVMRKFEVCLPVPHSAQEFLLPDLLPIERPTGASWETGWDNALQFLYQYEALPRSILVRLMVRLYTLIDYSCLWRHGMVIQHPETNNRARIEYNSLHNSMRIDIDGPTETRRELLKILRHHFLLIHKSFAALKVEERVPFPGYPERSASYVYLLELQADGFSEYRFEGVPHKVNINQLLDSLETPYDRRIRQLDAELEAFIQSKEGQRLALLNRETLTELQVIHQKSLGHLEKQAAQQGSNVETRIIHERDDLTNKLKMIEYLLTKGAKF